MIIYHEIGYFSLSFEFCYRQAASPPHSRLALFWICLIVALAKKGTLFTKINYENVVFGIRSDVSEFPTKKDDGTSHRFILFPTKDQQIEDQGLNTANDVSPVFYLFRNTGILMGFFI